MISLSERRNHPAHCIVIPVTAGLVSRMPAHSESRGPKLASRPKAHSETDSIHTSLGSKRGSSCAVPDSKHVARGPNEGFSEANLMADCRIER
jgi:hypothetical protein